MSGPIVELVEVLVIEPGVKRSPPESVVLHPVEPVIAVVDGHGGRMKKRLVGALVHPQRNVAPRRDLIDAAVFPIRNQSDLVLYVDGQSVEVSDVQPLLAFESRSRWDQRRTRIQARFSDRRCRAIGGFLRRRRGPRSIQTPSAGRGLRPLDHEVQLVGIFSLQAGFPHRRFVGTAVSGGVEDAIQVDVDCDSMHDILVFGDLDQLLPDRDVVNADSVDGSGRAERVVNEVEVWISCGDLVGICRESRLPSVEFARCLRQP